MSVSARLSVKNYRCFDDSHPIRIHIVDGFISIVGRNNSGKSSLLKFFYDFRELWRKLSEINMHREAAQQRHFNFGYVRNIDPISLFYSGNERDLEVDVEVDDELVEFKVPNDKIVFIKKIKIKLNRLNLNNASIDYFDSSGNEIEITSGPTATHEGHDFLRASDGFAHVGAICELFSIFKKALYIGPFRNAINQGQGDYYDLKVGEAFITQWNAWKNGPGRVQNKAISRVTTDIRNIFEYSNLDVNASPDNKTLKINANDSPYEMDDLGAGLAQFIIVLGNAAINAPSIILIDEPELHLHPALQIDFLTSLAKYSTYGVMFATHSLGLARSVSDYIYSCQQNEEYTIFSKFDSTPNYIEFLGEMSFSAYKEMGYESILLVEGVTDVKTFQQFLRKLKIDHRVVILPLGGNQLAKGGVEAELNELKRLSDNVYALVDSEKDSEASNPSVERAAFKETCERLGFKVHLTEKRATENYFTDDAVKKEMGENFSALGDYDLLRDSPMAWSKHSNWRIASHMTRTDLEQTDIGLFLASIL